MLNRRFLRIKVMQMLYSFFQHENGDVAAFEKELFKSLDKIHNLYLHILALFIDMHHVAFMVIDEQKNKYMPTAEELNPNLKFVNNTLLAALSENKDLKKEIDKQKVSWQNDFDLVRKLFSEIKQSELYKEYISSPGQDIKQDREFLIALITDILSEHDVLVSTLEEKNIHWTDDSFVAFNSVIRNFETFDGKFKLMPLLKDEEDDKNFVSILFKKTILYTKQYEDLIQTHTKNWELERIANMDVLLMKMAIAEIIHLPNIPIKVSLNEYIDISKEYSTPNSKTFVNGVLDKIIADLKRNDQIQKSGRGLQEN
jgi:N utilization substance protein B